MKLVIGTMLLGPIGLILAATGCDGGSDTIAGEHSEALAPAQCEGVGEAASRPDSKPSTEEDEPQGPRATIGAALQKVCLTDDQRTQAQQIGERVSMKEDAVLDARHALRALLLDSLEAGQI